MHSTEQRRAPAVTCPALTWMQGISSILVKDKQEGKAVEELVSLRKQVEEGTKEADFSAYEVRQPATDLTSAAHPVHPQLTPRPGLAGGPSHGIRVFPMAWPQQ